MDETPKSTKHVVPNALRLAGDTLVVPGTSLLFDGKIGPGMARVAAGVAAGAFLGPIGWFAVAADAYAKSTTGTGILEGYRAGKAEASQSEAESSAPASKSKAA